MNQPLNSQHAVYVGSFDPITLGHEDIIARASRVFPRVTVGVGINPDKAPLFTADERVKLLTRVLQDYKNVTVEAFSGLTVDYVRSLDAGVLIRGLRTVSDIETEFTMTLANHHLDPEIETMFLMASEKYAHISSTLIKQIAKLGQSAARNKLNDFIPKIVVDPLIEKYLAK